MHKGLDFSAPTGTKIYATGDGVIKKVKRARWGYGTHVVIDHGYGYTTLYGHMSRAIVRQGQRVKRGQQIGLVGSTDVASLIGVLCFCPSRQYRVTSCPNSQYAFV